VGKADVLVRPSEKCDRGFSQVAEGPETMADRIKVAILGGGCGAMAAAFELTKSDRFEVTVYQQGWRLGGKCASGRGSSPEKPVEEHGLHMLLGFYDEAFKLMAACYEADHEVRAGQTVFPTFRDALIEQNQVTFQEPVGSAWRSWNVTFQPPRGFPGQQAAPRLDDLVVAFAEALFKKHRQVKEKALQVGLLQRLYLRLLRSDRRLARAWRKVAPSAPSERAYWLARRLKDPVRPAAALLRVLALLLEGCMAEVEAITNVVERARDQAEVALKHDLLLLRLGFAGFKGLVKDVLLHDGDFSRIDHLEFRAWLMQHGAREQDVWSAPVKGLYDLGFAYVDGEATDRTKAQAAAGVAMYVSLQLLFGCRGALLWKMRAGAGDILFSPLYEVLRSRGVTFKFFHRVDELALSKDGTKVDVIRITRQANVRHQGRAGTYEPLIEVPYGEATTKLQSWPSEPLWDQLPDITDAQRQSLREVSFESDQCKFEAGKVVLRRRGSDAKVEGSGERGEFDHVILGIAVGGLSTICKELVERRPAWRSMVSGIRTVQTQALQLWMAPTLEQLGWSAGATVSISYVEPHDAWGEMSHLLAAECWQATPRPAHSVQYFCSVLPEFPPGTTLPQQRATARVNADAFLDTAIAHLWPTAVDAAGKLDRRLVVHQYLRVNVDASERYVLSVPGSIALRLHPECSTFSNLYLAGDWVMGRVNSGSVEAAMSGGIRAAKALSNNAGPIGSQSWSAAA